MKEEGFPFTSPVDTNIAIEETFTNGIDNLQDEHEQLLEVEDETTFNDEKLAEELPEEFTEQLLEGAKKTITINAYERNAKARQLCIEHWKPVCAVCNFDFEEMYGDIGKGFIHVHHLTPVSQIGNSYEVDPVNDLRPVCPNCHAMLHRQDEILSIEELKLIVAANVTELASR